MKPLKHIILLLLFSLPLLILPGYSQDKTEKQKDKMAAVKDLVESGNFVFITHEVYPFQGGIRHLTSDYDVKTSKDKIVTDLPYFGRAFMYVDPNNPAYQFTSTDFTYDQSAAKKGWNINIKFKDQSNVSQFIFRVFNNGNASLQVTSINRDPITYEGVIESRSDH